MLDVLSLQHVMGIFLSKRGKIRAKVNGLSHGHEGSEVANTNVAKHHVKGNSANDGLGNAVPLHTLTSLSQPLETMTGF